MHPSAVTIFIEIHAKPGQEEFTKNTFTKTIATSNKPGLISYEIFEDSNEPGTFYSMQEWESIEAFKTHMSEAGQSKSGEHSDDFKEATSMLREPPRTSVFKRIARANWDADKK